MPKYKRKALPVDAFQWMGDWDQKNDPSWIVTAMKKKGEELGAVRLMAGPVMKIVGRRGILTARKGDFIIRGPEGEIYPCTEEVFHLLHEEV